MGTNPSVSCLSTGWAQGEWRSAGPLVRLRGAPGLAGQDCPGWGRGEVRLRKRAGAGMGCQLGGLWPTITCAANPPVQEALQGEVWGGTQSLWTQAGGL